MESEYKKAHDFVTNTGQGLMDEGNDTTKIVKKMCSYYYVLDLIMPIMGSRASTKPLEFLNLKVSHFLFFAYVSINNSLSALLSVNCFCLCV
jgi:hypothetical protein